MSARPAGPGDRASGPHRQQRPRAPQSNRLAPPPHPLGALESAVDTAQPRARESLCARTEDECNHYQCSLLRKHSAVCAATLPPEPKCVRAQTKVTDNVSTCTIALRKRRGHTAVLRVTTEPRPSNTDASRTSVSSLLRSTPGRPRSGRASRAVGGEAAAQGPAPEAPRRNSSVCSARLASPAVTRRSGPR